MVVSNAMPTTCIQGSRDALFVAETPLTCVNLNQQGDWVHEIGNAPHD